MTRPIRFPSLPLLLAALASPSPAILGADGETADARWPSELLAVATLPADTRDTLGDTLGSFSALSVESFAFALDGSFSAELLVLPDRGYNRPEDNIYSDYAARLHGLRLELAPPASPDSAWTARLASKRTRLLFDDRGRAFTGQDPADGVRRLTLGARSLVLPASSDGRVCLDAEGLALARDGTVYVSDEYTPAVFVFGKDLALRDVIVPPPAFLPRRNGEYDFGSTSRPDSGRRNNQGLEGLALSPDGSRLFVLTQSALMQDSAEGDHASRRWARLLVYDVSQKATPAKLLLHHVLELPLHPTRSGGIPKRTAAQSEILALSHDRIVVLCRDNHGLGSGKNEPPLFKALVLYELSADATNLVDTAAETDPRGRVTDAGRLRADITPLRGRVVLDLLEPSALARVGLHLDPAGASEHYLSEKWEALALVPTPVAGEFLLLVGNDNDFQTRHGHMGSLAYDAKSENPNRILVYRVRLP